MIRITPTIFIDERQIEVRTVRASGPGGQHVNKASTAVELRFDAARCPGISDEVRRRLRTLAGRRMTDEGLVIIDAREHRSQLGNRRAAMARLVGLLRQAAARPRRRRKTLPTAASRQKRLDAKRRRGRVKRLRHRAGPEDD